jgi:hypothetical protein
MPPGGCYIQQQQQLQEYSRVLQQDSKAIRLVGLQGSCQQQSLD